MLRTTVASLWNLEFPSADARTSNQENAIGLNSRAAAWTALVPAVLQLGLLALVVRQFEIESAAFFHLTLLAFAGFLIHILLPFKFRLPFFVILSMTGVGLILGPRSGAAVIALGCILIALCHLPISFRARIGVLVAAGGVLAALRTGWIDAPVPAAAWPILGSMFMFRILVYLYDLRHSKDRPRPSMAFSYFFLLPNVCFPLFPVVDYQTMHRTYYNENEIRIYQRGIDWMFRGITHILLYRFLYHYVSITPADVGNIPDLLRYFVGDFGLYLHISGQFHLIVGMLHLFGFNLPPTSHLYFLASSFTDLWRRINIYWKDFLMKMFYYPAVFRLLKYGTIRAVVLATLFVFLATWVLHSYQWFWLRGSFPVQWQDGAFWGILALLVINASVREARKGKTRKALSAPPRSWSGTLAVGLRTVATVFTMAVLWSMWFCESFSDWLAMWPAAFRGGIPQLAVDWQPVMVAGVGIGAAGGAKFTRLGESLVRTIRTARQSPYGTGAMILCLLLIGVPSVQEHLGSTGAQVVSAVRSDKLNARDGVRLEKSYYESLIRVERFNSQLWEVYTKNQAEVNEWGEVGRTVQFTGDFRLKELRPDLRTSLKDRTFSTNRFGLRDRDYEEVPPAGTLRVALLGSSVVVGSGVGDGENFESLLEERLNREATDRARGRFEILNFAVGGYGPLEQVVTVEKKVLASRSSVLLYAAHDSDEERAVAHLAKAVYRRVTIPYPELRDIAAIAADSPSEEAAAVRLRPRGRDIVAWAYRHIASQCLNNGIRATWMFLPAPHRDRARIGYLKQLAEEAGFEAFDFSDAFANLDLTRLTVSEVDYHPNPRGHQVLADRLYDVLREPVFQFSRPQTGLAPDHRGGN
jgi:hypothetical protein